MPLVFRLRSCMTTYVIFRLNENLEWKENTAWIIAFSFMKAYRKTAKHEKANYLQILKWCLLRLTVSATCCWGCSRCVQFQTWLRRWRWYVPVELLRQPVTLKETSSLAHSHLTGVSVGVEVDRCVIDRGLWDIRLGGGRGCHPGWGGGIRWGGGRGGGIQGCEGGAARAGFGGGRSRIWGSRAGSQRKGRLWRLRWGSWCESRRRGGNGGYFRGFRG